MTRIPYLAPLVVALAVAGCTRFNETYYVGVMRKDSGQPLQFYRFTMRGCADWGTKTEYESGWYPASALQAVVGEYRLPTDPKRTLERAKEPAPGTTAEPLALDFERGGSLEAEISGCRFGLSPARLLSLKDLAGIKWSSLLCEVQLAKRSDAATAGSADPGDVFRVSIKAQRIEATAVSDMLAAVFGPPDKRGLVEFRKGRAKITGMRSITARDAAVDAKLAGTFWESVSGQWRGLGLKELRAEQRGYLWTVTGGNVTIDPQRSEGGAGSDRIVAEVKWVRVEKAESLTMQFGWHLTADKPVISPLAEEATVALQVDGCATYEVKRSAITGHAELAKLVTKGATVTLQLKKGQKLPGYTAGVGKSDLKVRSGVVQGKLKVTPNAKSGPDDFRLYFHRTEVAEPMRDPYGLEYFVIGPEGSRQVLTNQRLVIFMSSDPGPITSAIQAFAESEDVQNSIAKLLGAMRSRETGQKSNMRRTLLKSGLLAVRNLVDQTDAEAINADFIETVVGRLKTMLGADAP